MALNFGFDLDGIDDYVGGHLRIFISLTLGILVFVGLIAVAVFFVAVRGKEQVMVPDVTGRELSEALLELQSKELYPKIQLRSSTASDRGTILEQNPQAGTIVKAERRITLVISQGAASDKVGNYLGRNINDVRSEIASIRNQAGETVLSIKEPFMYQYAREAPGTIIQQRPEAGTDISGPMVLELVVSRGQENVRITVPDLTGLTLEQALDKINQARINFIFSVVPSVPERAGVVAGQEPLGGTEIDSSTKMEIILNQFAPAAGEIAGLFKYTLPNNPYPVSVTVDAELPSGSRRRLVSATHLGGPFSLPYRLPEGSVIILSMLDRELYRQPVTRTMESLATEEL